MKKTILSIIALATSLSINSQTLEVYKYKANGTINSMPAYTTSEKVKVVFKNSDSQSEATTELKTNDKVEGAITVNDTTYTRGVGGTVANFVDLGLKDANGNAILWATHNLGASKPEDYGAYIAWADKGVKEEGYVDGIKTAGYEWTNLAYCNGSQNSFTKYITYSNYGEIDYNIKLESIDDAATVNWGSNWHTPTTAEWQLLKENCTWTWYENGNTEYNGIAGNKITGTNGNSIFIPASGYHLSDSISHVGIGGLYWSSILTYTLNGSATYLDMNHSGGKAWNNAIRCNGFSIRPVRAEASSTTHTDSNLLPGKFTVNASGKQVQFTKGNLYWDGSEYKLEDTQIASSQGTEGVSYNEKHISHFYWTNMTDYSSGNIPYSENWFYSSQLSTDKFWCNEDNPITVQGTDKLYTLTGGNNGEWDFLISGRKNANSLYKDGVSVDTATNCLIIAPDNYDYVNNPLKSSYTLGEINRLGLICFPSAGCRHGSCLWFGDEGYYGLATPNSILILSSSHGAYVAYESAFFNPDYEDGRLGLSIRLVRTVE